MTEPGVEETMSHERVCKEHTDSFSKDCPICKLEAARNELVQTFWYVAACCAGPHLGRPVATQLEPLKTILATNEAAMAMKETLDHLLEVASTMVDRYAKPTENPMFPGIWEIIKQHSSA
jgi:hypothetical protein